MVKLTIYVEGGVPDDPTDTVGNSAVFRENFHQLFIQKLPQTTFDLAIHPIGQISQASNHLKKITDQKIDAVLLIDLDAPKTERKKRLADNYASDPSKVFFMIQEMEAWIISQPEKIEDYARSTHLVFKRPEPISDNPLIKNRHPEEIKKPGERLNTLLGQYFSVEKMRKGRLKKGPKSYAKSKDGPALIGLLQLEQLMLVFEDVQNLVGYIENIS